MSLGRKAVSSPDAVETYHALLAAVEDELCLTIPAGAFFPLTSFEKDQKAGQNVVLARMCTKHLFEVFEWIMNGGKFEGKTRKGVIITGPPGDGKVSAQIRFGTIVILAYVRYLLYSRSLRNTFWRSWSSKRPAMSSMKTSK